MQSRVLCNDTLIIMSVRAVCGLEMRTTHLVPGFQKQSTQSCVAHLSNPTFGIQASSIS